MSLNRSLLRVPVREVRFLPCSSHGGTLREKHLRALVRFGGMLG